MSARSRAIAARARGFLLRCRIPRGSLGGREPRNRRERRAAQRGPHGATTRGPRPSGTGAVGADATRMFCATGGGSGGLPPGLVHTCKHLERAQKTCGERDGRCQGRPAGRPVRPLRARSVWAWRHAVADALEREVSSMAHGRRSLGLSHRARKLRRCGTVVTVRACRACGAGRAGSGRYVWHTHGCERTEGQDVPALCEARSCWLCQRRRATPLRRWLEGAVSSLPLPDEHTRWSFLTIAPQYAPDSEREVSAQGLRERLIALQTAVREIMRQGARSGAIHAAFAAYEVAGTGHVHAHVLLAARWLDRGWLDRTAVEAGGRQVHVWIESADGGTAREVAKYVTKLISPMDEGALSGLEDRELLDPRLAAAWEVATYGARLHERYGALRSVPYLEGSQPPPAPDDATTSCSACGTVGEWRDELRGTRGWVRACYQRGVRALEGSCQVERRSREREERGGWYRPQWGRAGGAREHNAAIESIPPGVLEGPA